MNCFSHVWVVKINFINTLKNNVFPRKFKMHLSSHYVLLVLIFDKVSASLYYGDQSINQYLTQFCASTNADHLLVISQPKLNHHQTKTNNKSDYKMPISQKNNQNKILKHFQANCRHEKYDYIKNAKLSETLFQLSLLPTIKYKLPRLQILINFEAITTAQATHSAKSFHLLLSSLNFLYKKCLACLPFILLFSSSQISSNDLADLTNRVYKQLNSNFKLILVFSSAGNQQSTPVIHLNPIVDGCLQLQGVFAPKSELDFARLKVHYSQCNLHNLVVNVTVNNDVPFCRLVRDEANGEKLKARFSIEMQLLNVLEKRYFFQSNLIDARRRWGLINRAGQWTGVIGSIVNGVSLFNFLLTLIKTLF